MEKKRAILAVSFGTSYADTCAKTIEALEQEMQKTYPQCPVYRAWTSGMIRRKVEKRDGVHIFSVKEALEQMHRDGITEVAVQPTHVLNGIENDRMLETIAEARHDFEAIAVGNPLLTTQEDLERVTSLLKSIWNPAEEEMVVFMGHGTEHDSDMAYAALNYRFWINGCEKSMVMGTVEGYPGIEEVLETVVKAGVRTVILTPFMIVAGDHANHDLAGEEEDSWKSQFEKAGYSVKCVLKGLGEYEEFRQIFVDHLADAMKTM